VRIREEIARGPDGYQGSTILVRRYLRTIRPARGRIYQEVQTLLGEHHRNLTRLYGVPCR
jgi:hypothetical protein